MEKTVKRQRLIIIILAVALVVAFVQINGYKTESENRYNSLSNHIQRVSDNIQEIYGNVDRMLEEEASLVTSFNYEYGKLDAENRLVPVSVKITPKTYTDKTTLTLDFGSEKVGLNRGDDGEFIANFNAPLFPDTESEVVKLLIKDGNTTQTQELEWYISSLHNEFLPRMLVSFVFDNSGRSEDNNYKVDGDIMFHFDYEDSEDVPFKNMKVYYMHNDTVLEKENIPETVFDSAVTTFPLNKNFSDVKEGDSFTIYLEGEDECGFVHRVVLSQSFFHTLPEGNHTPEIIAPSDGDIILDKDENILYSGA